MTNTEPLMSPGDRDSLTGSVTGVLQKLLDLMGIEGSIVPRAEPVVGVDEGTAPVVLDIEGDDLGILIGRRGQTLSCLQYIVRLIVGHQLNIWVPVIIDVEGYKQRRYEALQALALHMAEQVKARGTPFTLEPMSPFERRIIHLALAENPNVTTQSVGEGEARKVVIIPKNDTISKSFKNR